MRNLLIVLLVTVLMVVLATQAFAGVFDTVKSWVFGSNAVLGAITLFFTVLSGIFGITLLRFKEPVKKIYLTYCEYRDAKLKDSQGGEQVTREEWDNIFKKLGEAVMALLAVCPGGWAKRLNTG